MCTCMHLTIDPVLHLYAKFIIQTVLCSYFLYVTMNVKQTLSKIITFKIKI